MSKEQFIANSLLHKDAFDVVGDYVHLDGEEFYKIAHYDKMRPFFMTLISHSDHWLFVSTTGGISAGRKNEQSSLFPYYTDDKITDSADSTGCKTILKINVDGKNQFWLPFSNRYAHLYRIERNLYKNVIGNKLIFEEINKDLHLLFRYAWQFSEKFGFVRKCSLLNLAEEPVSAEMVDGFLNILPYGINTGLQNERSNLANAYKKNELDQETGLGLFLLSSIIVDKAEPSEALMATTVWSSGLEPDQYLLSSQQLEGFIQGKDVQTEMDIKGEPGAFFLHAKLDLESNTNREWQIIAELNQDHTATIDLIHSLKTAKEDVLKELADDVQAGCDKLTRLVAMADGLQLTADKLTCSRHFSNVLFNIMRGGIFDDGYSVQTKDFTEFVSKANKNVAGVHNNFVEGLPDQLPYQSLLNTTLQTRDTDLIRICYEYLPLTFSRRHGDPSRPWNKFSIETRKKDGSKNLDYQGNWRDIFQNWEALAYSFPLFINSMISRFANASTIDGYNPYRIMRDGIDWEVIEPDDPWSFIGYWGDHQIIYLLKLLEISYYHEQDDLLDLLEKPYFVYANVPYIIRDYEDLVKDPKDTIVFDHNRESEIAKKINEYGTDGKMVFRANGQLLRATLAEKLLVTLLSKLSNFVPEGGIWLNTQRPEWNDANNALVGNGVSMVTLYYLRRYISFCIELFGATKLDVFIVNSPVSDLLSNILGTFEDNIHQIDDKISNEKRRTIMDSLGMAGAAYRNTAYNAFEEEKTTGIGKNDLLGFLHITLRFVDHSIKANRRQDGLYHSYNLIQFNENKTSVSHLYEMLEGQVAVLSSGMLHPQEAVEVLDSLKESKIYRPDQFSYLLYPDRSLPRFLDKNNIPESFISNSNLVQSLIAKGDTSILNQDVYGQCHFNGSFTNVESLKKALEKLKANGHKDQVEAEYSEFMDVFEQMFNHKAFTGRSGTFFGYEGLGSIYWHMVSKLLLAVNENINRALDQGAEKEIKERLTTHYYQIRTGIGVHKSPTLYGAYPTDPYSHTPANKGVQQPGMTGQVKEDIISRWGELGVRVNEGKISFSPHFLRDEEFLTESGTFEYYDTNEDSKELEVKKGELVFTYCQVPVTYVKEVSAGQMTVEFSNGSTKVIEGFELPKDLSAELFNRSDKISSIRVI